MGVAMSFWFNSIDKWVTEEPHKAQAVADPSGQFGAITPNDHSAFLKFVNLQVRNESKLGNYLLFCLLALQFISQ